MGREASYDSITGFYRSMDGLGTVRDANGQLLRPGDTGYAAAALRPDNLVTQLSGLQIANNQSSTQSIAISESPILAPFAKVNGNTFFGLAPPTAMASATSTPSAPTSSASKTSWAVAIATSRTWCSDSRSLL